MASRTNIGSRLIVLLLALLGVPNLAAGQSYTLAPSPFQTALDNSGNIINAACVWTYTAGTTTAVTTYSNSTGTTNANPIIADSAGRFTVYLAPGSSYRFIYESTPCSAASHGSTLVDRDNIAAVPVSGLNVDVTVTAGATIAVGDVAYVSDGSGGLNAGQVYQADADNTYSSTTAVSVGIATAAISATASGTVRTTGRMTGLSGLTAGEIYYVSATAGGLTATPPTNARCVGKADSTTSLIMPCDAGVVRVPDSNGTHSLVVKTTSNLTADRILTVVTGDADRTLTLPLTTRFKAPQGRCTLTSATPVTTSDVTAATTLYYALYGGNNLTLYDGSSSWVDVTFSQLSIAVPATTNTMYDVFVDYTAGTPALEVVAWTNAITRATALATQDGVYVQTSDTDSLYVCSFRTTGVSGQTEDSIAKRYLSNYYNRVDREMRVCEATNEWGYTTATWRQAGGVATNQLDFMVGVSEDLVSAEIIASARSDTAGTNYYVAIGLDSTTAPSTASARGWLRAAAANATVTGVSSYLGKPGDGGHTLTWLEYSEATGVTTWWGDSGGTLIQSCISGWIKG